MDDQIHVWREGACPYCQGSGKQTRYRVADETPVEPEPKPETYGSDTPEIFKSHLADMP